LPLTHTHELAHPAQDLDADLANYTSARGADAADESAEAAEAAPAEGAEEEAK
jgi:hypothetical protein